MRTGLRGHENPALDVARAVANKQGLPLVAAAFMLKSHTYPTARRYQFWLQGLHDTQLELRMQVSRLPLLSTPIRCVMPGTLVYLYSHDEPYSSSIAYCFGSENAVARFSDSEGIEFTHSLVLHNTYQRDVNQLCLERSTVCYT